MPLGEGRQSCPPQKIPWSPQRLGQSDGFIYYIYIYIYIYIYVVEVKMEQNGGLAACTLVPGPTSDRHFIRRNLPRRQPFLWKLGWLRDYIYRLHETS